MDLRDFLDVLRSRWKLVAACTLLGLIAAGAASLLTTPQYTSTTKVFVSAADSSSTVGTAYTGSLYTQQIVKSLVDVVTSERVTKGVVDQLQLDKTPGEVASQISATNPLDTVIVQISATDPTAEQAQQIAQATADQFSQAAQEYTQPGASGPSLVTVSVVEPANLPTTPSSPRTTLNLLLGALIGLVVGVGAAVLLETLDTRIKSVDGLQKHFDAPILAAIASDPEAAKKPLVTQIPPQSKRTEAFRQLRTNLQFVDVDNRPRSIVVASSIPKEGKSTTAINLAITVAQSGQPVILVEGDLRRPRMAEYLGMEGAAGLTDVLIGRAALEDVLQPWGPTGTLWVLPSGPLPPNPAELVGSQAMADLIGDLEKRAFVIIDVPPLLPVTDGAVLARLSGGALLVAAAGKVRREQLRAAEESIGNVDGRILGLVFTKAPQKGPDAHRYSHGYGYDKKRAAPGTTVLPAEAPVVPAGLTRATAGEPVIGVRPPAPASIPVTPAPAVTTTPNGNASLTAPPRPTTVDLDKPERIPVASGAPAGPATSSPSVLGASTPPAPPAPRPATVPAPAPAPRSAATPSAAGSAPAVMPAAPSAAPSAAPPAPPAVRTAEPEVRLVRTALPDSPAGLMSATASPAAPAAPTPSAAPVSPPAPPPMTPAMTPPATPQMSAPVTPPATLPAAGPAPDLGAAPAPSPLSLLLGTSVAGDESGNGASPGDEVPVDWTPPAPRPAFDPLTAPLDELARWEAEQQRR